MRILIIATGGTIGSVQTDSGVKTKEGTIERVIERALLEFESVLKGTSVEIRHVIDEDSTNMNPEKQRAVAKAAYEGVQKYDAVVITHGTDTLHYLSTTLSLMLHTNKPVVITGASVKPEEKNTDAVRNLGNSLITASDFARKEISGVFVVFNGKIMPGEWTYEKSPNKRNAFVSIHGNVGTVGKDGEIVFRNGNEAEYTAAGRPVIIPKLDLKFDDKVGTVRINPGVDEELLRTMLRATAKISSALLVEVYPSVGFPDYLIDQIKDIAKYKVVVATPHTPGGKGGVYQVSFENVKMAGGLIGLNFEPLDNAVLRYALGHVYDQRDLLEVKKSVLLTQARILEGDFYRPIEIYSEDADERGRAIDRLVSTPQGRMFLSMAESNRDLREARRSGLVEGFLTRVAEQIGIIPKNKDRT